MPVGSSTVSNGLSPLRRWGPPGPGAPRLHLPLRLAWLSQVVLTTILGDYHGDRLLTTILQSPYDPTALTIHHEGAGHHI